MRTVLEDSPVELGDASFEWASSPVRRQSSRNKEFSSQPTLKWAKDKLSVVGSKWSLEWPGHCNSGLLSPISEGFQNHVTPNTTQISQLEKEPLLQSTSPIPTWINRAKASTFIRLMPGLRLHQVPLPSLHPHPLNSSQMILCGWPLLPSLRCRQINSRLVN